MNDATSKLAELRKMFPCEPEVNKKSRSGGTRCFPVGEFGRKRFRDIDGLLTGDTVDLIYGSPTPEFTLQDLAGKIATVDRYKFWKRVFELRGHIPEETVFYFWYECVTDPRRNYSPSPLEQVVAKVNGRECPDPKSPENLPPADELLIDNPAVCARYCRERKPGWEMLRCLSPCRPAPPDMPEKMRRAIEADRVETFMIFRDMTGKRLSCGLLMETIRNKAYKIFSELLKECLRVGSPVTPERFCVLCVSRLEDALSVPALEIVEKLKPGTVKNVRDRWGRNLLWYAAANRRTAFFHPFCRLTPFLLECGCDPENENQLGLPWRTVLNRLSLCQKEELLRERQEERLNGEISPVQRDQPRYALTGRRYGAQWLKELRAKKC